MKSTSGSALSYVPALDGMRAVSIMLVVLAHFGLGHIVPGGMGVTIFFFISGFIITRLLIHETSSTGTIHLPAFYLRRAFRLAPALMVFVLVSNFAILALGRSLPWQDNLAAIFYAANYWHIFHGFSGSPENIYSPLSVLWSLAVEEHFYFFFPFLMVALHRKPETLLRVIVAMCLAILLWRCWLVADQWHSVRHLDEARTYKATDTRIDSILFGCLLSVWSHLATTSGRARRYLEFASQPVFVALGGLVLLFTLLIRNELFRESVRYSIQGIGTMMVFCPIFFGQGSDLAKNFLSHRLMTYTGQISYSLYLYHWLVFVCLFEFTSLRSWPFLLGLGIPLSFALAHASHTWIETPFRKIGHRLSSKLHH